MAIKIGSNIEALRSQRLLGTANSDLNKAQERLSSGLRINRASDDAAGLSVSSSLSFNSRVFGKAIQNANDTISLLSIAEGACPRRVCKRLDDISAASG